MRKLIIILAISLLSTPILACESGHSIKSKSSGGSVIVLKDNAVWEIDSINRIDSTLWLSIEDIVVCDDELINLDTRDKINTTQLR